MGIFQLHSGWAVTLKGVPFNICRKHIMMIMQFCHPKKKQVQNFLAVHDMQKIPMTHSPRKRVGNDATTSSLSPSDWLVVVDAHLCLLLFSKTTLW